MLKKNNDYLCVFLKTKVQREKKRKEKDLGLHVVGQGPYYGPNSLQMDQKEIQYWSTKPKTHWIDGYEKMVEIIVLNFIKKERKKYLIYASHHYHSNFCLLI